MIQYSLVLRGDPRSPEKGKKVFASAQSHKVMTLDDIVRHMALHGEKYGLGDYRAMVCKLSETMAELLREGNRLDIADLGRFYTTLECTGADTPEGFDPKQNITGMQVHWTPGKTFKNLREGVTFKENIDRRTEQRQLKEHQQQRAEGQD